MKRKSRAIALIATMVAAVAVAMVITATLMLVPGQLDNSVHTRERELAQQAALSGMEYALNRLRSDPQWKGLDNTTVVDTPSLKIVEDSGNVIGRLTAADGSLSQFTIRFNYQNGPVGSAGAEDGLPDPSAVNRISSPTISFNNLAGTAAVDQLREQRSGLVSVGLVAPLSGVLWVEGSAGQGLGQSGSNRRVVRVNLENWVGADTSKLPDAGLYGPQKILAKISGITGPGLTQPQGALQVKSSISTAKAKVRGLDGVEVTASVPRPYLTDAGGQVVVGTAKRFTVNGSDSSLPTATQESIASQKARWPKLKWSEVPKAVSTDTNIRAGTYVWNNSGGLDYYRKDFSGSVPSGTPDATLTSGSDLIASGSGTISLSPNDKLARFSGRFFVQPQGTVKSFTVMADPTLEANGVRPTLYFERASSGQSSMLSGGADINLLGATRGSGSISSEGNLTLQGDSIFEVALQDGVALYTKKDLVLQEIPPPVSHGIEQRVRLTSDYIPPLDPAALPLSMSSTGTDLNGRMSMLVAGQLVQAFSPVFFRDIEPTTLLTPKDIALQGVLYAQGGIRAKMPSGGSLFVRGVVIAYGGDPENQEPATSGGLVEVEANSATILYDPSYYQSMLSKLGPREIVTTARYFH